MENFYSGNFVHMAKKYLRGSLEIFYLEFLEVLASLHFLSLHWLNNCIKYKNQKVEAIKTNFYSKVFAFINKCFNHFLLRTNSSIKYLANDKKGIKRFKWYFLMIQTVDTEKKKFIQQVFNTKRRHLLTFL